jgi:GT2 family glycosyltransferase
MPKVTVVIPSYNHGRFLAARIDSVLGQTYPDFEVLFLDDASPDDSLRVFARYRGHPKIRSLLNTTNSGSVFKQWNKGVREARGEYVWLAESDDVADVRFLERLVPLLEAHPRVGLAYCNSLSIDASGAVLGPVDPWTRPLHPQRWDGDFLNDGREECRWYLVQRNSIPNASAVLLRKSVYEQVGYASEDMRLLGDWEMWVRMLLASDIAYLAEPLNYYRATHGESMRHRSMKHPEHLSDYLRIVGHVLPHGPLPPEVRQAVLECVAWHWEMQVGHSNGIEEPRVHLASLRRAWDLDPDLALAILSAAAANTARTCRDLLEVNDFVQDLHKNAGDMSRFLGDLHHGLGEQHRSTTALQLFLTELHQAAQNLYAGQVEMRTTFDGRMAYEEQARLALQRYLEQGLGEIGQRLDQAEAAVVELNRKLAEQADQMRFWQRLRGLLLPRGGWRHRLLRGFRRLFRRMAA